MKVLIKIMKNNSNIFLLSVKLILIPSNWYESTWFCRIHLIFETFQQKHAGWPFLYLGLPIGGDPRRLVFWEPVVTRLKNKLSGWKSHFLSFGGRLVLFKSILTFLPVYALSFCKAPSCVISTIESILIIKKNWGGEDSRKIYLFTKGVWRIGGQAVDGV
jgi:hypothetical protein